MSLVRLVRVFLFHLAIAYALLSLGAAPAHAAGMRRIAVVVGANDPPPGRATLRFAHDDAKDVADVLERVGGFTPADVHVLLDPHPGDIARTFDQVARTAGQAGGDVLFVFYYSGHSDGQSLFPHGEAMSLADVRARVEKLDARIRVGILDTCRGGSWTQSKGLSVGPPLRMADLMNVDTEGTALVSSSSGLENAHEALDVHGSFFTHYLAAGLRGAADQTGDGNVTLAEAFDYAKERTVRDSARLAKTPQHPSFDLALRGRQDIVLTTLAGATSALQVTGKHPYLEVIHLPSGVTVADAPNGTSALRIAVPPGRYLVRSVVDGKVYAKEIEVHDGETATLAEGQLEATGSSALAMKGAEPPPPPPPAKAPDGDKEDDVSAAEKRAEEAEAAHEAAEAEKEAAEEKADAAEEKADEEREKADEKAEAAREKASGGKRTKEKSATFSWEFPECNGLDDEGTPRVSTGCGGAFGLRGSVAYANTGSIAQGTGLEVAADGEDFWHNGIENETLRYRLALGGGGEGLEGTLMGGGAFGFRVPVTEYQGPVFRAGAEGHIMGDNAFYSSALELPELQAGWQWSKGHAVIDVAATTGVILTGKFRAYDAASRDLGTGFAYGGRASLQVPWVRLTAVAERLPGDDGLGNVDLALATLCVVASPAAICADGLVQQGTARVGDAEPFVRAAYAGLTIGFTGEH
jgi:hypothetical protein